VDNVVFIIEENKSYNTVTNVQKASIPYFNQLRTTGVYATGKSTNFASATAYSATGAPSAPNYLSLTSGRLLQNGSDGWNAYAYQNIVDLLVTGGVSYGMYMENLPANWIAHQDSGLYAQRHNPFGYYTDITGNSTRTPHIKDYSTFVPGAERFQWITPNLTDDGHTSSPNGQPLQLVNTDAFLKTQVPIILNSAAFAPGKKAVLIITWDEGGSGSEILCCVFLGPGAKTAVSNVTYNHYSMLATWESMLGLGNLGQNDATATVMNDMFGAGGGGGSTELPVMSNRSFSSEVFAPNSSTQGGSFNESLTFAALSSEVFTPSVSGGVQLIHPAIACGTASLPASVPL
jgi:hypothetical protein